jgi:VanZ family protein
VLLGVAVLIVSCASLLPSDEVPVVGINDKLEHFAVYVVLGAIGCRVVTSRAGRIVLALSLVALGIGLEFGQLLVPGRTAEIADAVFNSAGVISSVLILGFFTSDHEALIATTQANETTAPRRMAMQSNAVAKSEELRAERGACHG